MFQHTRFRRTRVCNTVSDLLSLCLWSQAKHWATSRLDLSYVSWSPWQSFAFQQIHSTGSRPEGLNTQSPASWSPWGRLSFPHLSAEWGRGVSCKAGTLGSGVLGAAMLTNEDHLDTSKVTTLVVSVPAERSSRTFPKGGSAESARLASPRWNGSQVNTPDRTKLSWHRRGCFSALPSRSRKLTFKRKCLFQADKAFAFSPAGEEGSHSCPIKEDGSLV